MSVTAFLWPRGDCKRYRALKCGISLSGLARGQLEAPGDVLEALRVAGNKRVAPVEGWVFPARLHSTAVVKQQVNHQKYSGQWAMCFFLLPGVWIAVCVCVLLVTLIGVEIELPFKYSGV